MSGVTVFHTTRIGNARKISSEGWVVAWDGTNIFGRGLYFWEYERDAHRYGAARFHGRYDVVSERIPVTGTNSIVYDQHRRLSSTIDQIAGGLLRRGIDVIVIPNHQIEGATMTGAQGRAYLWLVDMNQPYREVRV